MVISTSTIFIQDGKLKFFLKRNVESKILIFVFTRSVRNNCVAKHFLIPTFDEPSQFLRQACARGSVPLFLA